MILLNKRFTYITCIVSFILLIPFIAMQFTNEVNWKLFDFLIAGVLLFGTGLLIDFVLKKVPSKKNRILLITITLIFLIVIWTELAVGIFGSPLAGS